MDSYELDGEKYYYKNGKWLTSNYMSVPTAIISRLNKLLVEKEDISEKSVDELIEMLDGAKRSENTQLALKSAERAMEIASVSEIRTLLPRLTSLYRQIGRPQKAVDTAEEYLEKHKKNVWSPALFTSIAAAYCDLDQFDISRKYANKAKALTGNNSSPELISVYARLKNLEE